MEAPQRPAGGSVERTEPSIIQHFGRRLFDFNGRAGRLEFILYAWIVPPVLLVALTALTLVLFPDATADDPISDIGAYLWLIVTLAIIFAAGSRRLHDMGRSGWYIVFAVIPLVNLLLIAYLVFTPGKRTIGEGA